MIVSHDIPQIFYISQKVAMLDEGIIRFSGHKEEVLDSHNKILNAFYFRAGISDEQGSKLGKYLMERRKNEFYVGLFVIIGLICIAYLFVVLGELSFGRTPQYKVYGHFTSVSGLKIGARIEMAGVPVGTVSKIEFDKKEQLARVEFSINEKVELSEDIIASVKTSGIIGQKYIDIAPGGSEMMLNSGDEIFNTESSLDIESLIRKFIFNRENTPQ